MLGDLVYAFDPMVGFKIYNATVVLITCVLLGLRTHRSSSVWLLFPLLIMADSDVSWFKDHWYLVGCSLRIWRTLFTGDLVYSICVSVILTVFCIDVYRKWSRSPI